jgi:aspartyl-tRNA synthetase
MFGSVISVDTPIPFPRMTYKEAMEQFGSDKPDTRFEMKIGIISEVVAASGFRVFSETVKNGGIVAGICAPGAATYSRSQLNGLTDLAKTLGAGGLVYLKLQDDSIECSASKFVTAEETKKIAEALKAKGGDLVLIITGSWQKALTVLGSLRLEMANRLGLIRPRPQRN